MSGLGQLWESLMPEITRTLGDTAAHPGRGERVTLSRASTLEDAAADRCPFSLSLVADALAGATNLVLELPDRGKLVGGLLAGSRLAIDAQEFLIGADATASGTTIAVSLSAPIVSPLAAGVSLDLHPGAVFVLEDCLVSRRYTADFGRHLQPDHLATVSVPCKGAPVTPRLNDSLTLEDGTVGRVANEVLGGGAWWRLQMGA